MDLVDEGLRLRKLALKPIKTKRTGGDQEAYMTNGEVMDDAEPLSPKSRLFHAPGLNCYIISMMGTKTKINVDAIKAGLKQYKHPRFSSILVVDDEKQGEMRWVKTKVDIEKHVIVPDLDPNMDSPDKFVEEYVTNLTNTPIDLSIPLWEVHLLDVKSSEADGVIVSKIHHSIGDGASLMSSLFTSIQKAYNPESSHNAPLKKWMGLSESNESRRFISAICSSLQLIWNTFLGVISLIATVLFLKDTKTPLRGELGLELTPKRFVRWTLSLDDIKLVKNAMNVTVNDVLLGVTEAGLSRYLNRRYAKNEKDEGAIEKKSNLPRSIRLRATLYMNLRPPAGTQASGDMRQKDSKVKTDNKVGYVIYPFTIALQNNPLDYIRKAKATTYRKKNSLEASYTLSTTGLIFNSFGFKAAAALYYRILSNTTMTYSSLVGSLEEINYFGHPLTYMAFGTYGYPRTLSIHFVSYVEKATLLLVVDQDVIPDPHRLCDDLEKSLKVMKDSVIQRGVINNPA